MVIKGRRREGKSSVNDTAARRQLEANLHQKGQIDEIFSLAVQYHQRGNFQYADILYKKILETNPTHYQSLRNLGLLAKQFKECDTSKRLLEQVIQINPHHADSYNNLGSVNQELGEIEQAIDCYKKAIQISPNHSDAYNNLGVLIKQLGETEQVISCYKKPFKSTLIIQMPTIISETHIENWERHKKQSIVMKK